MKFTSVAIVAAFLCVAVSAAPSSPVLASGLFDPLDKLIKKVEDLLEKVKCARNVAEKEFDNSGLENEFKQFKATIEQLTNEYEGCSSKGNKIAVFICSLEVGVKLSQEINEFTEKVKEANQKLAEAVMARIQSECLNKPELFELVEQFQQSAADQFQCTADYMGELSEKNGLGELWSRTQPQLQYNINLWKKCPQLGNKFLVGACNVKESVTTFKLLNEYMKLVASQKPLMLVEFSLGLPKRCNGKSNEEIASDILSMFAEDDESIELFDDHLPQFPLPPFLAKIKCQTRAIDRGVAGTKYQEIFDEHRFWMHEMIDNIQGVCVKKSNKLETAVCIGKSLKKGLPSLVPFVKQLLAMKEELKSQPELAAKVAAEMAKCNV